MDTCSTKTHIYTYRKVLVVEKEEYEQIKSVCENYGYATVMSIASALWRYDFNKNNFPTDGVLYPVQLRCTNDECKPKLNMASDMYYDIVKGFEEHR